MNRRKREQNEMLKRVAERREREFWEAYNGCVQFLQSGQLQAWQGRLLAAVREAVDTAVRMRARIAERAYQDPEFRQQLREMEVLDRFLPGYDASPGERGKGVEHGG